MRRVALVLTQVRGGSIDELKKITNAMRLIMATDLSIDYRGFLGDGPQSVDADALSDVFVDKYWLMCATEPSVFMIDLESYTYLWDATYERVVAVYGTSPGPQPGRAPREKPRIAYYYRNIVSHYRQAAPLDTGHFIAHSLGGRLDINLFPQRRDINRGLSAEGRFYRAMERAAASSPGAFLFSRPIYFDETWMPYFLEYGLCREGADFETRIFDNV